MFRYCLIGLAFGLCVCPAGAYYIGWEGDCLPEEAGWERSYGDWSGIPHGTGAVRTISDGVMTMDSLYDPGVFDIAVMHRPFNPAPGEMLVMEWRLAVDEVMGMYDPGVALFSDDSWVVAFRYDGRSVFSLFDPGWSVSVARGEFYEYRMTSWDMRVYQFYVNDELVHEGVLSHGGDMSRLAWGDNMQGAGSLHRWDYLRIYTIPEPACLATCVAAGLFLARKRRDS